MSSLLQRRLYRGVPYSVALVAVVYFALAILSISQLGRGAKADDPTTAALAKPRAVVRNEEVVFGFAAVVVSMFVLLRLRMLTDRTAGVLGVAIFAGALVRVVVSSIAYGGFWGRRPNWFAVGVVAALTIKGWQFSAMSRDSFSRHYARMYHPILSLLVLTCVVSTNFAGYYGDAMSSSTLRKVHDVAPIASLQLKGSAGFLYAVGTTGLLTLVELCEGPLLTTALLSILLLGPTEAAAPADDGDGDGDDTT